MIDEAARADLETETSPHALLAFLTLDHYRLTQPVRLVSDVRDYILNGETYLGMPFEVTLLADGETAPRAQLRVQNVDRRMGETIRTTGNNIAARVAMYSSADFDLSLDPREQVGTPQAIRRYDHLRLVDVTVTPIDITGTLMLRDYSQEPYPGKRATMSRCPALFR